MITRIRFSKRHCKINSKALKSGGMKALMKADHLLSLPTFGLSQPVRLAETNGTSTCSIPRILKRRADAGEGSNLNGVEVLFKTSLTLLNGHKSWCSVIV